MRRFVLSAVLSVIFVLTSILLLTCEGGVATVITPPDQIAGSFTFGQESGKVEIGVSNGGSGAASQDFTIMSSADWSITGTLTIVIAGTPYTVSLVQEESSYDESTGKLTAVFRGNVGMPSEERTFTVTCTITENDGITDLSIEMELPDETVIEGIIEVSGASEDTEITVLIGVIYHNDAPSIPFGGFCATVIGGTITGSFADYDEPGVDQCRGTFSGTVTGTEIVMTEFYQICDDDTDCNGGPCWEDLSDYMTVTGTYDIGPPASISGIWTLEPWEPGEYGTWECDEL